jgi:hypothetical protein
MRYVEILLADPEVLHVAFIPQVTIMGHPPILEGDECHVWIPLPDVIPAEDDQPAWTKLIGADLRPFPEVE